MSQTPLDVSGKLHAEPAELDEEEESSDEEPTPKKQKSTRRSKKVLPFLFFLDIRGMLSSNDDFSFPCSGMSLELSRSRKMSRRRSPRRAPKGRGCVLQTDGGVEGQVEGEEEEKGIKITCFLFFF